MLSVGDEGYPAVQRHLGVNHLIDDNMDSIAPWGGRPLLRRSR